MEHFFDTRLLRTQVYQYLQQQIKNGKIKPGQFLNMNQLAERLDVSRTPLRDALLQLQAEKFITLLPQRGIRINELSIEDVKNIAEVLGALDSQVMLSVFEKIGPEHVGSLKQINARMKSAIKEKDIYRHWELNIDFHDIYSDLSHNSQILYYLSILRQRLFGFGDIQWGRHLMTVNYNEHQRIIALIEKGDGQQVADFIRNVHMRIPS